MLPPYNDRVSDVITNISVLYGIPIYWTMPGCSVHHLVVAGMVFVNDCVVVLVRCILEYIVVTGMVSVHHLVVAGVRLL